MKMEIICVLGLGYIGLPTASLFAVHGYEVIGVDVNHRRVESLQRGKTDIEEPGLGELVGRAVLSKHFKAQLEVEKADIFIIAVPTPLDERRRAELRYVRQAVEMVVPHLRDGVLVILESTVPPGTCQDLVIPILRRVVKRFYFSYCPERALPGNTLFEITNNHRIIGSLDRESARLTRELYSCFVRGDIYLTDVATAEMVKLVENAFRDANIAFANELAQLCDELNLDVWQVIHLANEHPRVNILSPGPGVGGHCVAVDPWFIAERSRNSRIIQLSREINDSMPGYVFQRVKNELGGVRSPIVAVLGLAYKRNVDDARETPALKFMELARAQGWQVKAHDPYVRDFDHEVLGLEEALAGSDCAVFITDHDIFKWLDPEAIGRVMRGRLLVDTRNFLDHDRWRAHGFKVVVLGQPE